MPYIYALTPHKECVYYVLQTYTNKNFNTHIGSSKTTNANVFIFQQVIIPCFDIYIHVYSTQFLLTMIRIMGDKIYGIQVPSPLIWAVHLIREQKATRAMKISYYINRVESYSDLSRSVAWRSVTAAERCQHPLLRKKPVLKVELCTSKAQSKGTQLRLSPCANWLPCFC